MKSFSKWTFEEVENEFQITRVLNHTEMEKWITFHDVPSEAELAELELMRVELELSVFGWNEQELIVNFIGPLVRMVNFNQKQYHAFLGRELSVKSEKGELKGWVDFVVAAGIHSPRKPYFLIHEYKQEQDSSNDPLGQLLITMVAAQIANGDNQILYGAYVRGRMWHFVLLDDKQYAVHSGFNATQDEIVEIFGVLQNTKKCLDRLLN